MKPFHHGGILLRNEKAIMFHVANSVQEDSGLFPNWSPSASTAS